MESLTQPPTEPAGIEGYEERGISPEDDAYPLDDVMVRSEIRTVSDVVKRIQQGRYLLDPDFQRDLVWLPDKQSKLIESCVMRIPLPVFYVAEMLDGRVAVVDGLQRLSTFLRFKNNDLKLTGLGGEHPLEGKTFDQLAVNLQERVEDTQITLYILDKEAPDRARLDIFERVNSGVPLTRQQMRNAIYNGSATQWLGKMAKSPEFQQATGNSLNPKTMRDREAINRFAAFRILGSETYAKGDMDEFLAKALKRMNKMSEQELEALGDAFISSMKLNYKIFGKHAFRKSLKSEDKYAARSLLNISLFDSLSVALSKGNFKKDIQNSIRDCVMKLLGNYEFDDAISRSTNSDIPVKRRFRMAEKALSELAL